MAGYRTSVRLYFYEPQASENTAQVCHIQPYCLLNHQIIDVLYTTVILARIPISLPVEKSTIS